MQLVKFFVVGVALACAAPIHANSKTPVFVAVADGIPPTILIVYDDSAYLIDAARSPYSSLGNCAETSMPTAVLTPLPIAILHERAEPDLKLDPKTVGHHADAFSSWAGGYDATIVSHVDGGLACYYIVSQTMTPGVLELRLIRGYSPTFEVKAKTEAAERAVSWLNSNVYKPLLRKFRSRRETKTN